MSALHVYVLRCDAPDCKARFERDLTRADLTRVQARAHGWVHGIVPNVKRMGPLQSRDYCPEHVELGEALITKALPLHAREVAS
jgi:hypothetical protein